MQPSPVLLASRIYEQGVLLTRIIARQRYKLDFYKLLASATPDPAAAFTCLSPPRVCRSCYARHARSGVGICIARIRDRSNAVSFGSEKR